MYQSNNIPAPIVLKSTGLPLNKGNITQTLPAPASALAKENMKRDIYQRRSYAARRMSKAVDRFILASDFVERDKARKWVEAWRNASGIRKPVQAPASATTSRKLRLVKG